MARESVISLCMLLLSLPLYISRLKEMTEYFMFCLLSSFISREKMVRKLGVSEAVKKLKGDVLLPEIWLGFRILSAPDLSHAIFSAKCQNK